MNANNNSTNYKILSISILIMSFMLVHYLVPQSKSPDDFNIHSIFLRLNFFPIILAAIWFGKRGGLLSATIICVFYIPHSILFHKSSFFEGLAQVIEFITYFITAYLLGYFSDKQRLLFQQIFNLNNEMIKLDRQSIVGITVASLVHEIKNPMTIILGLVDMYIQSNQESEQELGKVIVEIERINKSLSDTLRFSKPVENLSSKHDLNVIVKDVSALMRKEALRNLIKYEEECKGGMPIVLLNEIAIKQILYNLVLNSIQAIKRNGKIYVKTDYDNDNVYFSVEDDGPGLPSGNEKQIFKRFYTTKNNGTGLGLAIVKDLVDSMGGEISVESVQGVKFEVKLPRCV